MSDCSQRCIARLTELGAPLFGWICVDVEDMGSASFVCDLCGYDRIRYVHVMEHPEWNGRFHVGCVCDGTMSGNMLAAKQRDDDARKKSARRVRFMSKPWRESPSGTLELLRSREKVIAEPDSFRGRTYYRVKVSGEEYQWYSNRRMESLEDVKRLVFEVLEYERKSDRAEAGN